MLNVEKIKEQLRKEYSINENNGIIYHCSNTRKILRRGRNQKTLILTVGVQGAGKTTFCEKNFTQCTVVNWDGILKQYLQEHNVLFDQEVNKKVNLIFFDKVKEGLEKGITVADTGAVDVKIRLGILEYLQDFYTKSVLVVLNPPKSTIIEHIKQQIEQRWTPYLWENVDNEYEDLQFQIDNGILPIGVNEVYMVK